MGRYILFDSTRLLCVHERCLTDADKKMTEFVRSSFSGKLFIDLDKFVRH